MTENPETRPRAIEDKFPRAVWIRVIIYIAVGHLFAAFVYFLFAVGAK